MSPLMKFANVFMTIFIRFSVLSSPGISRLVKASDEMLIQKLCSQTLEVEACEHCILSDTSRETDSIPELTHSIIFCLYTQSTYGHENADMLAQKTTGKLNQALSSCSTKLFEAANLLGDGLMMIEGSNYVNAFNNLKQSRTSLDYCTDAFRKIADAPLPDSLLQDMTPMNRLFDVAQSFFRLIINVSD